MKRTVSAILLAMLLTSMLYSAFKIIPAEAAGTIYIRADGSIDPPTAPISRDGDTYTFTGNVSDGAIVVERDNVVVDGAGYTLQGTGSGTGIVISGRSNVTIKNMTIKAFHYAIWLESSSNSSISGNTITNNEDGIMLYPSSNYNRISGNNITNNWYGVGLDTFSSYNSVSGNNMTGSNGYGIVLYEYSSYNSVSGNNIANNLYGILLGNSSNYNSIFHNNFINDAQQVISIDSVNVWDDGYPSGGNYWSDYSGIDEKNGPNQDQPGSDGIGDAPYIIEVDNRDRYPLMIPWVAQHDVAITNVASCKTVVSQGYSLNMNVTAANLGNYVESFFDVYMYASNLSSTYQIGLQTIALNPYETAVLAFTWDTHGLAKGNYTLWAYAEPVVNETETADNTYTDGVVTISMQGDINADNTVNILDIVRVALAFGAVPANPNWDPNADINGDKVINIVDIAIVALHFGETG